MMASGLSILATLAAASSVSAQAWPLCFEDGGVPTPEAYVAFREAAHTFREAGLYGAKAKLSGPRAGDGHWEPATLTAYVELLRAGVPGNYLAVEAAEPSVSECLSIVVEIVPPAENPPGLWHLRGVYGFESGSVEITSPGGQAAVRIAGAAYAPGARVILDGHADTVGTPEASLELSRRRAEAVAAALVREGVPWEDIEIRSHGETRLATATPDETPAPLNRRVDIDMRYPAATAD